MPAGGETGWTDHTVAEAELDNIVLMLDRRMLKHWGRHIRVGRIGLLDTVAAADGMHLGEVDRLLDNLALPSNIAVAGGV
jgi:hypothetical protein